MVAAHTKPGIPGVYLTHPLGKEPIGSVCKGEEIFLILSFK